MQERAKYKITHEAETLGHVFISASQTPHGKLKALFAIPLRNSEIANLQQVQTLFEDAQFTLFPGSLTDEEILSRIRDEATWPEDVVPENVEFIFCEKGIRLAW